MLLLLLLLLLSFSLKPCEIMKTAEEAHTNATASATNERQATIETPETRSHEEYRQTPPHLLKRRSTRSSH